MNYPSNHQPPGVQAIAVIVWLNLIGLMWYHIVNLERNVLTEAIITGFLAVILLAICIVKVRP